MGTFYKQCESYLDKIDSGIWIEIGTDRGEGSTDWFAEQSRKRNTDFYTIDADEDQILRATERMAQHPDRYSHVQLLHGKGEIEVKNIMQQRPKDRVSLVYLDNYDWDYWLNRVEEPFVAGVKQRYRDVLKSEMTNINSQCTHLLQALRLVNMLADNSIVICDDTWFDSDDGIFIGKCSAAVPLFMIYGFQVVHHSGYRQNSGVILAKGENFTA